MITRRPQPRQPRFSVQCARILAGFLTAPDRQRYGLQAVRATGLPGGTVYPILRRLESAGWLETEYEPHQPHVRRRPRVYYRLTTLGREHALRALEHHAAHYRALVAWAAPEELGRLAAPAPR